MIDLVGAPFDLCGHRQGSRMGPAALRLAHLAEGLRSLGLDVRDRGDVTVSPPRTDKGGLRNFPPLLEVTAALRAEVAASLGEGRIPVVLGGEHTIAAAGVAAALAAPTGGLALLWIDAHADVNTPATSRSGNLHGMPIAALQGLSSGVEGTRDFEWRQLLRTLNAPPLPAERTLWLALRDVDLPERARVREGFGLTMTDVDRHGLAACVDRIDAHLRATGVRDLWISFDVDALDPVLAPGTGTAVRGGLTYREAHLLAELLHERLADAPYRLLGLDVVETNPLEDNLNATARMAVEWTLSLFGKTIL